MIVQPVVAYTFLFHFQSEVLVAKKSGVLVWNPLTMTFSLLALVQQYKMLIALK